MAEIRSLYDALVKTKVKEDQCTNFLLWLLRVLPSSISAKICALAEIPVPQIEPSISFKVQHILCGSRPDGLISLSDSDYLILETKRFANCYDHRQFQNHFTGGCSEFGEDNVRCLFLSGDERIPSDLEEMKKKHNGRIGFISWKTVLELFGTEKDSLSEKDRFLINEFLDFAKHYQLGKVISMKNDELREFFKIYPTVVKYEEAVFEKLFQLLIRIMNQIIIDSSERAEEDVGDSVNNKPCLYVSLTIDGWHLTRSSYLYLDIMTKNVGVMLIGYQDDKEKKKFVPLWNDKYKEKFKGDTSLCALTWVGEGEDDESAKAGYFKVVEGTSGKLFNPEKISEFNTYFYFGYVHPLNLDNLEEHYERIPMDFLKLMDSFLK